MIDKKSVVPDMSLSVGSVVRQLRTRQALSLAELANRSGVSKIHLSRLERLRSSPTEEVIRRLAAAFGLPVSVLFGEQKFLPPPSVESFLEEQKELVTELRSILSNRQPKAASASLRPAFWPRRQRENLVTILSEPSAEQVPHIKVVGIGEGGINAISKMIADGLAGVEFIVADTDAQALGAMREPANVQLAKVRLGVKPATGRRTRANPEVERRAALESENEIRQRLAGADMVLIIASMSGGTGSGGALVTAHLAKEAGALTIGVVSKPHPSQGRKLLRQAEEGIAELKLVVDKLVVVSLQKLLTSADRSAPLPEVFHQVDDMCSQLVRAVCDPIIRRRDFDLPQIAVIAPKTTREDPEGELLRFLRDYADKLRAAYRLIAPRSTFAAIVGTGYFDKRHVEELLPGIEGGILQVAYRVVKGQCAAVLFLYDPRNIRSDSPEFRALNRVCIEKEVPLLSTPATARSWLGGKPDRGGASKVPDWVKESTIALSAHDKKKEEMKELLQDEENRLFITQFRRILATGETGAFVRGWFPDLAAKVELVSPSRQGGDIEIAHEILQGRCQVVIVLTDPQDRPPDETEIDLLHRTCQLTPRVSVVLLTNKKAVERWINTARNYQPTLSEQLRMKYGPPDGPLKEALVVPEETVSKALSIIKSVTSRYSDNGWGIPRNVLGKEIKPAWQEVNRTLASIAARYVDSVLQRERPKVMAINWGETMFLLSEAFRLGSWQPINDLVVWPMVGMPGLGEPQYHASSFTKTIATAYGAMARVIASPLIQERSSGKPVDQAQGSEQAEFRELVEAKIAITSVGPIPPEDRPDWIRQTTILQRAPRDAKKVVQSAISKHAVGEIGALFFDQDGHPVETGWETVLSHEDLKTMAQSGQVVLVAGGDMRRYRSIKGALRGGFVSVLVTEPETAKAILEE